MCLLLLLQVLTEVYAARPVPLYEHVGLSLVLHKVVDPRREVRDASRALLSMLARRVWGQEARYRWAGLGGTGGRGWAVQVGGAGRYRGLLLPASCQAHCPWMQE